MFGDVRATDNSSKPYRDAPYTIAELKEELKTSPNAYRDANYIPANTDAQSVTVLPGGDERSGYGNQSIHDIYVEYLSKGDKNAQLGI